MAEVLNTFCPKCLGVRDARAGKSCSSCGVEMRPLFDAGGALSKAYLTARGECCDSGCQNCPYASAEAPRMLTCERCGKGFGCQVAGRCWCAGVEVSSEILADIKTRYRDCLCPACLGGLAAPGRGSQARPAQ